MKSKKVFILILLIFNPIFTLAGESKPYISPGIRLGYTSDQGLTFSFKISVGVFNNSFTNLTYGYKFPLFTDVETPDRNHFFELQYGTIPDDVSLLIGGGMGLFIYERYNRLEYGFKSSLFVGAFVFPSLEFETISLGKTQTNFGLEGVAPIPIEGIRF